MGLFRKGASPHQTAIAMIGAKSGSRVLVVGAGDAAIAAEVALVAGLNGHVLVVDRVAGAAARVDAAAAKAGALVEFQDAPVTMLPLDPDSFDIVVLNRRYAEMSDEDRANVVGETMRVTRPGGRLIVIEATPRPGLFRAAPSRAPTVTPEAIRDAVARAGWRASRVLADVDGVAYIEAVKPRDAGTKS